MPCVIHIFDSEKHGFAPNFFVFVQDPESSGQGKQALRSLAPQLQKFRLIACLLERKRQVGRGKIEPTKFVAVVPRSSNFVDPTCFPAIVRDLNSLHITQQSIRRWCERVKVVLHLSIFHTKISIAQLHCFKTDEATGDFLYPNVCFVHRPKVKRLMEDPTEFCCPVSHELMEEPLFGG